ncbi:MAG: LuxR C-terminal-related transcriptional regulator [Candidatus Limnocylindrales bacterium]
MTAVPGVPVILQTKLAPARMRPGFVARPVLVERLRGLRGSPTVGLFAPAGYGKSTLLGEWAERDGRPFAWLTLDERDNDPAVLLGYVALALQRLEPIPAEVLASIASPGASIWTAAVPRLGAAIAASVGPFVLAIDDFEHLDDQTGTDILVVLAEHLPPGSQIAFAGRSPGRLPVARLLAAGRLATVGADELALRDDEAAAVVARAGVALPPAEIQALNRRMEGWPVGVYLAALSASPAGVPTGDLPIAGRDQLVARYLREQLLDRLSTERQRFLTRTAVLDRLSGSLCDRVLERRGSAADLRAMAESNLFLVPLDTEGEWYRYHGLFQALLLAELEQREPELIPILRGRAADWYEAQVLGDDVLEYALAAGDVKRVLRLLPAIAQAAYNRGHGDTLGRWFTWLEERGLDQRDPIVAVVGQLLFAFMGDATRSERWAEAAEQAVAARGGLVATTGTAQPADAAARHRDAADAMVALGRAVRADRGIGAMVHDAELAAALFPPADPWRIAALGMLGTALVLAGRHEEANEHLAQAVAEYGLVPPPRRVAHTAAAIAASQRASLAMAIKEWRAAREHVVQARAIVRAGRLDGHVAGLVVDAVAARLAIQRGAAAQARVDLARAQRNRALLTHALAWQAVRTRLDLARVCLAVVDVGGARTLLQEVRDILELRPDLGTLVEEAEALQGQVLEAGRARQSASSLTIAELRLLPLLATHLTFREIGQRLFLSPNTVKSQALSIYRKLDASSRSEAVASAIEAGLADWSRSAIEVGAAR